MTSYDENTRSDLAPIMEELGFAIHTCQVFEYSLNFLLSMISEHRVPSQGESFAATWDFHSLKPMGRLLNALRKESNIPDAFDEFLSEGIRLRNFVVHDFFETVGDRVSEPKERLRIIAELKEVRNEIILRDKALEQLIDVLLKKYDLSTESLKERAGEHYDWINYRTETREPPKKQ